MLILSLKIFKYCPEFHKCFLFGKNDTDANNTHDAILLFHRSKWCLCNNIKEDKYTESVALLLKKILENGDSPFVRWRYDNGIQTIFDAGQPGKPISWNLQN